MDVENKMKRERKITISREDFEFGFEATRRGAGVFIDTQFKSHLAETLKKEYKLEPKDWAPLLKLWQQYNEALHGLYLTKTMEILNLGSGMVASVTLDDLERPTTKPKEKKKKEKKKKEKDPEWTLIGEKPKTKEVTKMDETPCESCSS